MKKYLLGSILLIASIMAHAVVMEGQIAPGSYIPIAADVNGNILTSTSGTATPNGPPPNFISVLNSSITPLGANGVFTGPAEDISKYAEVRVVVFSNQASATDGLQEQQSPDGVNWDQADTFTIPANTGKEFGVGVGSKFFRIVYTNGAVAQGTFRLQVTFHGTRTKPSNQRPQDGRSNENDFEEVLSYNMIYNGTTWDRSKGLNGSTFIQGSVAAGNASVDNPQIAGGVVQTNPIANTLFSGNAAPLTLTLGGALVNMPYSTGESSWQYVAAAGGITNSTTPVTIYPGSGSFPRGYITGCQISSTALGAATELVIRSGGSTVLWRTMIATAGIIGGLNVSFPTPLRAPGNNQTMDVVTLTASITGSVYINCQGYSGM